MKIFKHLIAAAVIVTPLLAASAPAEALTARQYQMQGHGRYVSSKARAGSYRMHQAHRHNWRRHHGYRRY